MTISLQLTFTFHQRNHDNRNCVKAVMLTLLICLAFELVLSILALSSYAVPSFITMHKAGLRIIIYHQNLPGKLIAPNGLILRWWSAASSGLQPWCPSINLLKKYWREKDDCLNTLNMPQPGLAGLHLIFVPMVNRPLGGPILTTQRWKKGPYTNSNKANARPISNLCNDWIFRGC